MQVQQLAQVGCRGYLRLAQNTRVEIWCFITQSTVTTEATRSFDFVFVMCMFSVFVCIFGFSYLCFRFAFRVFVFCYLELCDLYVCCSISIVCLFGFHTFNLCFCSYQFVLHFLYIYVMNSQQTF